MSTTSVQCRNQNKHFLGQKRLSEHLVCRHEMNLPATMLRAFDQVMCTTLTALHLQSHKVPSLHILNLFFM